MDLKQLIKEYLEEVNLMQVATSVDDQPWACTVYYAFDEDWNLYWISAPMRRHSEEIEKNEKVAGTIVLPHTPGDDGRGIQFQGTAKMLTDVKEVTTGIGYYAKRFDMSEERVKEIIDQTDNHRVYVVKPTMFVLFDEKNFPDNPSQEYKL